MVEKPPSADPYVEVTLPDVGVVALEHRGAATSPDESVRKAENQEVVTPQHKRRVNALAGLDLIR
jgi:hypothetical protein